MLACRSPRGNPSEDTPPRLSVTGAGGLGGSPALTHAQRADRYLQTWKHARR